MKLISDFESEISLANEFYRKTGQADVWKMHTGMRGGRYAEAVPGDFWGYLPHGRAILLEVKSSESETWTVKFAGKYRTVRPHQLVALRRAHECQVLVGVLLRLGKLNPVCFAFSWPMLERILGLDMTLENDILALEFDEKRPALRLKAEDLPEGARVPALSTGGWAWLEALLGFE